MDKLYARSTLRFAPLLIVTIFALFSGAWIFLSDIYLGNSVAHPELVTELSIAKGFFYIIVVSALLYLLIRRAVSLLEKTEARHNLLFNNMNDAVFLHECYGSGGTPGRFIDVNDIACQRLGYTRYELLNMYPQDIYDAATLEKFPAMIKKMREHGRLVWEGEHMAKDGHKIPVEISNRIFEYGGRQLVLSVVRDITSRKLAEMAIWEYAERLRRIFDDGPLGMVFVGADFRILRPNPVFCRMLGYDAKELLAFKFQDFTHPDHVMGDETNIYRLMRGEIPVYRVEKRYLRKDGGIIWATVTVNAMRSDSGEFLYFLAMAEDITAHKLAEESIAKEHNLLRTLIDHLPDSIYVKDIQGRKVLTNRSDLDFIGAKSEADVIGKTDVEIYPAHMAEGYVRDDQNVLLAGRPMINREELVEDHGGNKRWLLTSKIPLKDADGKVTGLVGIGRDITERKLLENRLLTMAHYDTLTAMPNRTLFLEKAGMGLAHARRAGTQCALVFVDLDHFKSVNDTLGHTVGDELLMDSAAKLAECVRETDIIARFGGDEFIIFLSDLEEGQGAQYIAERIREKFNAPRIVAGNDLFITTSMGIAVYPNDGETLEELLKHADIAMYAAKENGRNHYCFFNNEMNKNAITKMQIERGLRDAFTKNEFVLFYQPIVDVKTGRVRGFEALLRWFKREGGLVFPDEFIPVAEETGLIIPIGEWVLREACRFYKKMADAGHGHLVISVNISVAQLRRKNIVDIIREVLEESHIPPECLEVEVTESMLIESFDAAIEVLNGICALGVRISLDDFGTGYSSLVHLQRLPIANLKIDRMFIREIAKDTDENAMIPAIIDLAHKLNLSVIAEGVESTVQLEKLVGNNCDYFQGYLLSKPLPADDVPDFLSRQPQS